MSINFKYEQIKLEELSSIERLTLIKSIMLLVDKNDAMSIDVKNYLLDINLIFTTFNSVKSEDIRLLFYPDYEQKNYHEKLADFIRQCGTYTNDEHNIWLGDLIQFANENKLGKLRETIDKKIYLLEQKEAKSCKLSKERLEELLTNLIEWGLEVTGKSDADDLVRASGITPEELELIGYDKATYPELY